MPNPLLRLAQERIPLALETFLSRQNPAAPRLTAATRYAVVNGGKRVRPALAFGAAQALGHSSDHVEPAALAVELVHCYSLVHDDLPCMDNDDLRRGKPTTHKAFDEATALLAGDTLQALAFLALLDCPLNGDQHRAQTALLSRASVNMAIGQTLDIEAEGKMLDVADLEQIHRHKTGALIRASVLLPAIACQATDAETRALDTFADKLGLAFQVQDDVLDVTGDSLKTGKTVGADAARAKPTYPVLLGLDEAMRLAKRLHEEAIDSLALFADAAEPLRHLAHFLAQRDH